MLRPDSFGKRLLAVLLFALLHWLAWPARGFAPLLFVAWIPLFALEDEIASQRRNGVRFRIFPVTYLSFFFFNLFTTWWIWSASPFGMAGAVMANALLMSFVFLLFHAVKYNTNDKVGYTFLIASWLAFEFLHLDWDLTWTWLNLGNGFGAYPWMVQWYEYTGTGGGTFWILLSNILLYNLLKKYSVKKLVTGTVVIILPVVISLLIQSTYTEKKDPVEIVVIQPNIDPYNEKFSGMPPDAQLSKMLALADSGVTKNSKLIMMPETALPEGIWEEQIETHPDILRIRKFIADHYNVPFLTGAATYKFYKGSEYPATARKFSDTEDHYDAFNTALLIDTSGATGMYHKSKLVPGVEKMPYPAVFGYLDQFAIDLGGIAGSLGMQDSSEVFLTGKIVAAPVICYESVYGDYVGSYIRRGANLICIITNDGWWSDTPGYRQHLQYARLRAIEHRRSIARSANTGISCFIDQTGTVYQKTEWWVPAVIRQEVNLNDELTFYSRVGDFPGRIGLLTALLLLVYAAFRIVMRRKA